MMKKINRWQYALTGVVILLMAGLVYAWSVMSQSIGRSRPEWTLAQLSMTFTLVMIFFCTGGLTAGILAKKAAPRVFIILSGFLFLAGFFLAATTGEGILSLYIGFGILCGLGAGFAYNTVMSTVSAWFPDRQGLISGILLMGFGLSSFIIGKIYVAVTPADGTDGWKTTFRALGIIIFLTMLSCGFFLKKPEEAFLKQNAAGRRKGKTPALELDSAQMMKTPAFWFYYVWAIVISAAGLALVSQARGIAVQAGSQLSDGTIATVVGLISVMNGLGRVLFGWLFDRAGYRAVIFLDLVLFVAAGVILILALTTGAFPLITAGFLVGGMAYGGVTPTNSAIISDFFGRKNFPVNFSIINTNLIIASFSSAIAGRLYDASGSYLSTIIMMLGLSAAGFAAFAGIKRPGAQKR